MNFLGSSAKSLRWLFPQTLKIIPNSELLQICFRNVSVYSHFLGDSWKRLCYRDVFHLGNVGKIYFSYITVKSSIDFRSCCVSKGLNYVKNAPSPSVPLTTSAQNSPISRHKQFLPPNKCNPKLMPKISPSPKGSPRTRSWRASWINVNWNLNQPQLRKHK
jgi:hypothetical protein